MLHRLSICCFSLALASAAMTGCETNPSTGRSQFIAVSAEDTAAMGHQAKPELVKEYGGEIASPQLRQYVQQVGRRLAREVEPEYRDVKWDFTTLDSDVINAFALPGGHVFMSRGLLEQLDSEAALAGVLGHEIGHITARHVDERISHAMVLQGIAGVGEAALGGSSGGGWSQVVPLVVGVGGQGYLLKFGRDQEREADMQGLKYMALAGYDPMGMADVMRVLASASEGSSQWEILSTHPNPESRLQEILDKVRSDYPETQRGDTHRKFENRFERDAVPHFSGRRAADARMGALPASMLWCAHCRQAAAAPATAD